MPPYATMNTLKYRKVAEAEMRDKVSLKSVFRNEL